MPRAAPLTPRPPGVGGRRQGPSPGRTRPCRGGRSPRREEAGEAPGAGGCPPGWGALVFNTAWPFQTEEACRTSLLPLLRPLPLPPGVGRPRGAQPVSWVGFPGSREEPVSWMWGRREGRTGADGLSRLMSPPINKGRAGPAVPAPLPARGEGEHVPPTCCLSRGKGRLGVGGQGTSSGLKDRTGLSSGGQRKARPSPGDHGGAGGPVGSHRPRGPGGDRGAGDTRLGLLEVSGGSPSWPTVGRGWCWGGAQVGLQPPPASPKMPGLPCIWGPRWALTLSPALL